MASDCDSGIRYKADELLKEIDKKNPTFIQVSVTKYLWVLHHLAFTLMTILKMALLKALHLQCFAKNKR
jgi:hypothetical protein